MAIRKLCIRCKKAKDKCQCSKPTWRYQVDVWDLSGKRIRQLFTTKKAAVNEEAKHVSLKAESKSILDIKKDCKITFKELAEAYREVFKNQTSFKNYKGRILELLESEFGSKKLSEIKYHDLEKFAARRKERKTHRGGKPSASTLNKEVGLITQLLNKAVEWEMLDQTPLKRTLRVKERYSRARYLTKEEIARLLPECPVYLKELVEVAIHTGMRKGELFNLQWKDIAGGFIYVEKTKTEEPRQIPINDTLARVFKRIRRRQWQQGIKSEYVFTYQGAKLIQSVKKSFSSALKRAGIVDFRFHDLRHTFASQVLMRGGSLKEVQELLGHKDIKMTMRYAHLSQEHKRKAVNLLNDLTEVVKFRSNTGEFAQKVE
jgi:integrase